jgi:uncharacterized protein YjbI with pentapeptide repeats
MDRASNVRQHRAAVLVLLTGLLLGAVAALTLGRNHIWLVLLAAVLALLLGCVFAFPPRLAPPRSPETLTEVSDPAERIRLVDERLKLQNDIRTALLQAIGGAAVITGIFFTWQQLQTDRDQLRQQLTLTRQGQVAERFTRAIDQLGSGKLEVQLGGIYGLEQIARQAADEPQATSDRLQVYEVLTAYIRKHAAWSPAAPPLDKLAELQQLAPDVQAAFTVLARRTVATNDPPLDLHGVDLRRANGLDVHLEGADLRGAHLEQADLLGVHLEGANLDGAHLERAFLGGAHLKGAFLGGAHLERAFLGGAHLEQAVLRGAHLEGAFLGGAHLEQAFLVGAHLEQANLRGAHLEQANLRGAQLEGADLGGAQLKGATASNDTVWPKGFDWRAAGVTFINR